MTRALISGGLAALLLCSAVSASAQRRAGTRTKRPAATAAPAANFEKLAAEATAARNANRIPEAINLYRDALKANPKWDEGWWFLATLLYDRDEYAEAANAFTAATKLRPQAGIAFIMLGLCEYRLARYDEAATHLVQGRQLGFGTNEELRRVVLYHEGVIGLYRGEFEAAQKRLDDVAYSGARSEQLFIALGLVVLRIPQVPENVKPEDENYALIRQAGWAEYQLAQTNMQDATLEYDRLVAEHPKFPNVQYAYGRFLLVQRDDVGAMKAFEREIETSPNHAMARLQIAYIYLTRKEAAKGLSYAEEAVRLAPRFAHARFLLGRILYETGDYRRSIEELEASQQLAPMEPKIYYTLARAYDRVKRKEDAQKARQVFAELSRQAEGTDPNADPDAAPPDLP
jgi:tetratricopeptide (TPR) repeat protein